MLVEFREVFWGGEDWFESWRSMRVNLGVEEYGWELGNRLCKGFVEGGNMVFLRNRKKVILVGV